MASTTFAQEFSAESYQNLQATVFAIQELNQNPYILPNFTLGFKMFDTCLSEVRTIGGIFWMLTGAEKEVPNYKCPESQPQLSGVIGDFQSNTAVPMARILGLYKYPQVSHGSTVEMLSDKLQFPSYMRTIPNDKFQFPVLTRLIKHFGWNWVGVIASDNDYGVLGSQNLKKALANTGVCAAFSKIIPLNSSKTQRLQIADIIKMSTASVIVIYSTRMEVMPLMEEIAEQNITGKNWIATTSWIVSPIFSNKKSWRTLNGTFGLAIHRGKIPGLSEFIHALHPSSSPNDIFIRSFWEDTFGCYWLTDNTLTEQYINKTSILCTGEETLDNYDLAKFNLFDYRYGYNSYKAAYAIAHGLHDLLFCHPSSGPFTNKSCASILDFKPWQDSPHAFFEEMIAYSQPVQASNPYFLTDVESSVVKKNVQAINSINRHQLTISPTLVKYLLDEGFG
ncbi:extracellular calcium-sensing receptor-like [Protopterus annectens]|uniref:extracellular calcium-sensing receptor-like n=1 Tax=Protopterus annectens TaxID=7888 RepID=UPI001CFB7223|nr:extracellular calcium-sensing receptor-like [Protopterus annectens]